MCNLSQGVKEEGIEIGIRKGIERGIEQGMEKGQDNLALLMQKLFAQNRLADAKRATEDKAYRDALMKELKIG